LPPFATLQAPTLASVSGKGKLQVKYAGPREAICIGHDGLEAFADTLTYAYKERIMKMDQLSDNHEEIFKELLAEDVDRHFPAFARAYEAPLRSYIAGMGVHSSDVDDIAHEALIRIRFWLKDSHPQKIRTSNIETYLYRIAESCVRVKQREYRRQWDWSQFQDFLITEADIFDELIDSEL
jgi:hypothetical protein